MGFWEDDRIRHKNKQFNQKVSVTINASKVPLDVLLETLKVKFDVYIDGEGKNILIAPLKKEKDNGV